MTLLRNLFSDWCAYLCMNVLDACTHVCTDMLACVLFTYVSEIAPSAFSLVADDSEPMKGWARR